MVILCPCLFALLAVIEYESTSSRFKLLCTNVFQCCIKKKGVKQNEEDTVIDIPADSDVIVSKNIKADTRHQPNQLHF